MSNKTKQECGGMGRVQTAQSLWQQQDGQGRQVGLYSTGLPEYTPLPRAAQGGNGPPDSKKVPAHQAPWASARRPQRMLSAKQGPTLCHGNSETQKTLLCVFFIGCEFVSSPNCGQLDPVIHDCLPLIFHRPSRGQGGPKLSLKLPCYVPLYPLWPGVKRLVDIVSYSRDHFIFKSG